MPRLARLDAPGVLHHIIIRGIERRAIFRDDSDRDGFLERLDRLISETKTACYAWVLMTNHAHLLLRSGPGGISQRCADCSRAMRYHSIAGTDGMDNFFKIDTNQLFARRISISKN